MNATTTGSWFDRLACALAAGALVCAAVIATFNSPYTTPAVRWVRVATEHLFAAFVG